MICRQANIEYDFSKPVRIRPIADVHFGNSHSDVRAFKSFLSEDPDSYFIGNGDLLDSVITSDAKRYRKSNDGTEGDAVLDEQIDGMRDILEPYKARILGLGCGNHEDAITKHCGTNPMKRLCELLDVPFLGYSWLFKLVMAYKGSGKARTVVIRGHHGWGGGSRTQGADLSKFSRDVAYWDADVFLYGHVHRKQADRIPRLGLVGSRLVSKPKLLGICGTFLKTYSATGDPTYSEVKGYPPVEIGGLTVNIKPTTDWVKMWIDT